MVECGLRTLGFRIELADGFDLVAEEVNADGALLLGRVDVEDASAQRGLAGHFNHVDAGVADGKEMLEDGLGKVLFAGLHTQGQRRVELCAEQTHAGRFRRCNDKAGRAGADLPQRGGAGLQDFRMWREVLEWQNIVRWQANDLFGVKCAGEVGGGEYGLVQNLGGLVVGDEHKRGLVTCCGKQGQVQGARREGEARDAAASLPGGKLALNSVEGVGGFEVGEQVADKRKNHA